VPKQPHSKKRDTTTLSIKDYFSKSTVARTNNPIDSSITTGMMEVRREGLFSTELLPSTPVERPSIEALKRALLGVRLDIVKDRSPFATEAQQLVRGLTAAINLTFGACVGYYNPPGDGNCGIAVTLRGGFDKPVSGHLIHMMRLQFSLWAKKEIQEGRVDYTFLRRNVLCEDMHMQEDDALQLLDTEVYRKALKYIHEFGNKGSKSYCGGLWWKFCWEVYGLSFCFIAVKKDGHISYVIDNSGSESTLPFKNPFEVKRRVVYLAHVMPGDAVQEHFALLVPNVALNPPPIKLLMAEHIIVERYKLNDDTSTISSSQPGVSFPGLNSQLDETTTPAWKIARAPKMNRIAMWMREFPWLREVLGKPHRYYCEPCTEYYTSLGQQSDSLWTQPAKGRECQSKDTIIRHTRVQKTVGTVKKYVDGPSLHHQAEKGLKERENCQNSQMVLGPGPQVMAQVKASITAVGMVTHFMGEHRLPFNLAEVSSFTIYFWLGGVLMHRK
jgi:hypothetical protein